LSNYGFGKSEILYIE